MPEDIGHGFEAGAAVDHVRGRALAQHMGAASSAPGHPGLHEGTGREVPDRGGSGKRSEGRLAVEEERSTGGGRTSPAEIRRQGRPDVLQQRSNALVMRFARANDEVSLLPVDVVSAQRDEFMGA
jgi:hypothetical protein